MEVLQRTANRGSVSTGPYEIDNSLKFEPDNTEYMRRSNGTDGNQRVFTQSMWIKRTELGYSYATFWCVGNVALRFDSSDRLEVWCYTYDGTGAGTSNTDSYRIYTAEKFRDTSAWYHVVFALDTTQGTESNRLKVYVNNERVYHDPSAGGDIYDQTITQNSYTRCNGTGNSSENWNQIGWYYTGNYVFAGYIAEVNFVDGLQLSPTDVAEYDEDSGIWKPKEYTGAYGTNGYYLKFDDASDLGADSSGNDNDMNSIGNITAADQATDTPTNNFCTWNPLWVYASQPVISEGATKVRIGDSTNEGAKATIGLTNGKWYWEAKPVGTIGSQYIGIQTDGDSNISSNANSLLNNYTMVINPTGRYYSYSGSLSESSAGQFTSLTTSDWLGIALDMDSSTQTIKYYVNGSLILTRNLISEMQGQTVFPFLQNYENRSFDINFGGYTINTISSAASDANGYGTFEYAPPSGYYALCTKNLAEYG